MDMKTRLLSLNPRLPHGDIQRCIEGGERYAAKFDLIPPHDRESIAYLFAAYTLTDSMHTKVQIRRGIDSILAPAYPGARR
jgi:hypothetical protein